MAPVTVPMAKREELFRWESVGVGREKARRVSFASACTSEDGGRMVKFLAFLEGKELFAYFSSPVVKNGGYNILYLQ